MSATASARRAGSSQHDKREHAETLPQPSSIRERLLRLDAYVYIYAAHQVVGCLDGCRRVRVEVCEQSHADLVGILTLLATSRVLQPDRGERGPEKNTV